MRLLPFDLLATSDHHARRRVQMMRMCERMRRS